MRLLQAVDQTDWKMEEEIRRQEGATVDLQVTAENFPPESHLHFVWTKNEAEIRVGARCGIHQLPSGSRLRLADLSTVDTGVYSCRVASISGSLPSNGDGAHSSSFLLSVDERELNSLHSFQDRIRRLNRKAGAGGGEMKRSAKRSFIHQHFTELDSENPPIDKCQETNVDSASTTSDAFRFWAVCKRHGRFQYQTGTERNKSMSSSPRSSSSPSSSPSIPKRPWPVSSSPSKESRDPSSKLHHSLPTCDSSRRQSSPAQISRNTDTENNSVDKSPEETVKSFSSIRSKFESPGAVRKSFSGMLPKKQNDSVASFRTTATLQNILSASSATTEEVPETLKYPLKPAVESKTPPQVPEELETPPQVPEELKTPPQVPDELETPPQVPEKPETPQMPEGLETPTQMPEELETPPKVPEKLDTPSKKLVKIEDPSEVPEEAETPPKMPEKLETPNQVPEESETPSEMAVKVETLPQVPVEAEAPSEGPEESVTPEVPVDSETLAEVPVESETPPKVPVQLKTPLEVLPDLLTSAQVSTASELPVKVPVDLVTESETPGTPEDSMTTAELQEDSTVYSAISEERETHPNGTFQPISTSVVSNSKTAVNSETPTDFSESTLHYSSPPEDSMTRLCVTDDSSTSQNVQTDSINCSNGIGILTDASNVSEDSMKSSVNFSDSGTQPVTRRTIVEANGTNDKDLEKRDRVAKISSDILKYSKNEDDIAVVNVDLSSRDGGDSLTAERKSIGSSDVDNQSTESNTIMSERPASIVQFRQEQLPKEEIPFPEREVEVKIGVDPWLDYEKFEQIGSGGFSEVFRCREISSGLDLAAKVARYRSSNKSSLMYEIDILRSLCHPRVMRLYDVYDFSRRMYLITEYIGGGELCERIIEEDFLSEEQSCNFILQILRGVSYLHKQSVIHLDLKPENIVCTTKSTYDIKIIDFGFAQRYEGEHKPIRFLGGTANFTAPEVINYDPLTFAADIWAVGVIAYLLLCGYAPFDGDSDQEVLVNVTKGIYDYDDEIFEQISPSAREFIDRILIKNPSKRPTAQQLLRDDWLRARGRRSTLHIPAAVDHMRTFVNRARDKWKAATTAIMAMQKFRRV